MNLSWVVGVLVVLASTVLAQNCPTISNPVDGTGSCTGTYSGGLCYTQSCTYGVFYSAYSAGSNYRYCQNGNWTELICRDPNGHAADTCHGCCQPIGAPAQGYGSCGTTAPGSSCYGGTNCTYSVNFGSSTARLCVNSGTGGVWNALICNNADNTTPAQTCAQAGGCCDPLTAPNGATGSCPRTQAGQYCYAISCTNGYLVGSSAMQCRYDGTWSPLVCKNVDGSPATSCPECCAPLAAPTQGTGTCNWAGPGQSCSSQLCSNGPIVGSTTRYCSSTGATWSQLICKNADGTPADPCPQCCPALGSPVDGSGNCLATGPAGSCSSQTCNMGTALGSSFRTCQTVNGMGVWSVFICQDANGQPAEACPTCCPAIAPPVGEDPTYTSEQNGCSVSVPGSTCTQHCTGSRYYYPVMGIPYQRTCVTDPLSGVAAWTDEICSNEFGLPMGVAVGNATNRDAVGGAIGGACGLIFLFLCFHFFKRLRPEVPKKGESDTGAVAWSDLPDSCMENHTWWVFWGTLFTFACAVTAVGGVYMPWFRYKNYGYSTGRIHELMLVTSHEQTWNYCDADAPPCPTECQATSAIASATVAFACVFTFLGMVVTFMRAYHPRKDNETRWHVSQQLFMASAFFIFVAMTLHGGWCAYLVGDLAIHLVAGLSDKIVHSIGFCFACIAFLACCALSWFIKHKNPPANKA